ncbi:MAG: hypothetical protein HC883_06125 [Bdellovibrionaceae bacterium]|nr:hypothetical protein [Pseudobdellovibrionaceae bacterium]
MFESLTVIRKTLLVMLIAGQGLAWAEGQTVEVQNKSYWMCKNRKEVRTIRVIIEEGICSTFYSKAGEEKRVGSGKNHESCQNFLTNIKTNLEKSNWSCRDISSTRITASAE